MRASPSLFSPPRGQTSVEVLLVVGFILLTASLIAIVYVENQAKTNVSIQTKLLILPFLERNGHVLKIAEIKSTVVPSGGGNDLQILVRTKGTISPNLLKPVDCAIICSNIDPIGYYNSVTFSWTNEPNSTSSDVVCPPLAC